MVPLTLVKYRNAHTTNEKLDLIFTLLLNSNTQEDSESDGGEGDSLPDEVQARIHILEESQANVEVAGVPNQRVLAVVAEA